MLNNCLIKILLFLFIIKRLKTVKDSFLDIFFDCTHCRVRFFYWQLFKIYDFFKNLLIKICLVTFTEEILNGKLNFLCSELIFSQWLWDDWLFISAFFFWKQFLRVQTDWKTREYLFGMNLSLLYWFIWNKDFKWFIESISNIWKLKQFNFFHWLTDRQTDRQTDSLFLSWLFV